MTRTWVLAALIVPSLTAIAAAEPQVSPYLYLNRCSGGCIVFGGGVNDARSMTSTIPCADGASCGGGSCQCTGGSTGTYTIEEFRNAAGETGAAADAEWNAIVHCVREVYSPYNIEVNDTPPPFGLSHNQGIVAGRPSQIGYSGIGGIAPGTPGCDPRDNALSFTFANIYGGTGLSRIHTICYVAAQETAHAYGLDHSFRYSDGRSACTDPMSYQTDCGGQRFFRNDNAHCGEWGPRPCKCGGFQNTHLRLAAIFGHATPITTPPQVTINAPMPGAAIGNGTGVVATASAQRGIARLELWLNGYNWLTVKGALFGPSGQPETSYPLVMPASVPDGVIDIVVKAYDDLEIVTASETVTVTKGAPCTSAASCAKGQECSEGRCFWEPPTGQIGDTCDYPQFCVSAMCLETSIGNFCSQECVVGVADSCPASFTCEGPPGAVGSCVPESPLDTGCCSVGADGRVASLWALAVLGVMVRRRRRRC
jgi:hypothetical protein